MSEKTNSVSKTKDGTLEIRSVSASNIWDYENSFYWFSHPTRINKLIAHYELYKSITDIPGDVFEFGVYKAASLIRLASFRNVLENDFSRKIVGFDAFGKFPKTNIQLKADLDFIDYFEKVGGDGLSRQEVKSIIEYKKFENISLVEGNVMETLPEYLGENPAARIAFLHLDMDVKEPTTFALEALYDRVVAGGIIVFDDYGTVAGETDAVDEFLSKKNIKMKATGHYHVPAYVRKP